MTRRLVRALREQLARHHLRRAARRRCGQARQARRLGRHAPRPRRPRLHRPARLLREGAARDQPERTADAAAIAHEVRNEFVLQAEGEVVLRAPDAVNPNLPTGEIEIQVDTLTIVSRSEPLPFQIGEETSTRCCGSSTAGSTCAASGCSATSASRHTVIAAIRRTMDDLGFVDVWTPSMTKGTPEGARDFLVPVRLQPGPLLRARAVAAALQAALHGRRARPLLPDRHVLARRGSPRRPAVRVPAARPRDVVRRPGGRARRARGGGRRVVRGARARAPARARSRACRTPT